MRISDWSSDVCSSDLWLELLTPVDGLAAAPGLEKCDEAARAIEKSNAAPGYASTETRLAFHARTNREQSGGPQRIAFSCCVSRLVVVLSRGVTPPGGDERRRE